MGIFTKNNQYGIFIVYFILFSNPSDHFYATTKITQDKENTIITGGSGPGDNEPRQFRMKLPDKTIIAFLAVGIK